MDTIVIGNEKGGVTKTTLSINYAAFLARHGFRVLIIDTDPQGQAGLSFGIPMGSGLFELLKRQKDWQKLREDQLLVGVDPEQWSDNPDKPQGSIELLRSNDETGVIPQLVKETDVLRDRLEELEGYVDMVIIDTPPTANLFQSALYYAGDCVLVPTQLEDLSIEGLISTMRRVKNEIDRRKNTHRPFTFLGVQPTLMDWRRTLHKQALKELEDHFGETMCFPAISNRAAWADASRSKLSIYAYNSIVNEKGAREAVADADNLFNTISERIIQHG